MPIEKLVYCDFAKDIKIGKPNMIPLKNIIINMQANLINHKVSLSMLNSSEEFLLKSISFFSFKENIIFNLMALKIRTTHIVITRILYTNNCQ